MDHGTAQEGMECACCYDDIVGGKGGNYVEYRTGEGEGTPNIILLFASQHHVPTPRRV